MAFFLKSKSEKTLKAFAKKYSQELPELETKRLYLRKIIPDHANDMFEYSKDPNVTKYLTWTPHTSVKQTENYIKLLQKQYQNGSFFDWGLVCKEDMRFIGTCGFTSFDYEQNKAEIGYVISENYRGNGLACEAALKVMEFAFDTLLVDKVEAKFIDGNLPSARVMQKCGMKFEAIYHNSMFIKGEYKTIQVYSILKKDFKKQELLQ
jgi:Acetyltransferases, including N-acetylases of ribosomal proteins